MERRRHPRRLHGRRAADAQERRQGELAAAPAAAGERALRRPRVGAERRHEHPRDALGPDQQRRHRSLLRRDPQRRDRCLVQGRAGLQRRAGRSTGPRTARRCSASARRCRRGRASSGSCAGRSRTARTPFSPNEADWNKGKFVSDIDTSGKGVLDAAFSPDGKRIALVSNIGSSSYRLWLSENTGKADDFLLTSAKPTPTRACKVSWRSDSQVVIVVQGDAALQGGRVRAGPGRRRERARRARPERYGR